MFTLVPSILFFVPNDVGGWGSTGVERLCHMRAIATPADPSADPLVRYVRTMQELLLATW